MDRCSRFVFGDQEVTTEIAARAWTPADATIGGRRVSASGVPAAYVVRRDALLNLTLRFFEHEWAAIYNLLIYGQSSDPITWYPEATDDEVSWSVYLESPAYGETFSPSRDGAFPRMMEISIVLRGVGTAVPWASYFPDL